MPVLPRLLHFGRVPCCFCAPLLLGVALPAKDSNLDLLSQSQRCCRLHQRGLAERAGFAPAAGLATGSRLAGGPIRLLWHLSTVEDEGLEPSGAAVQRLPAPCASPYVLVLVGLGWVRPVTVDDALNAYSTDGVG